MNRTVRYIYMLMLEFQYSCLLENETPEDILGYCKAYVSQLEEQVVHIKGYDEQ
jgi:hypothetical protein